jgi:hypothetical protein
MPDKPGNAWFKRETDSALRSLMLSGPVRSLASELERPPFIDRRRFESLRKNPDRLFLKLILFDCLRRAVRTLAG